MDKGSGGQAGGRGPIPGAHHVADRARMWTVLLSAVGAQPGRVEPHLGSVAPARHLPYSVHLQNDADPNVSEQQTFLVVVAIDFGTTSSGYAYSFAKEPECIHVMR